MDERKHLLKRKTSLPDTVANFKDPLLRREEFSISLRKRRKQELI
jgi:hypothetical protein